MVWRGNDEVDGDDEDTSDLVDVELEDDENTYKVVCEDWLPNS